MMILQIVHELLMSYQKLQWPAEPDERVARVVLAVERELQIPLHIPVFKKCSPWWDCPVFRRVEALEKCVKQNIGDHILHREI